MTKNSPGTPLSSSSPEQGGQPSNGLSDGRSAGSGEWGFFKSKKAKKCKWTKNGLVGKGNEGGIDTSLPAITAYVVYERLGFREALVCDVLAWSGYDSALSHSYGKARGRNNKALLSGCKNPETCGQVCVHVAYAPISMMSTYDGVSGLGSFFFPPSFDRFSLPLLHHPPSPGLVAGVDGFKIASEDR